MTPKEKAYELILKVEKQLIGNQVYRGTTKKLALIAVDEIINSNPHSNPLNTHGFSTMAYWQEVKHQIENI
jgi:hypothetical protein